MLGIYPALWTDPEGDSCFSIYQINWIKVKKELFFCLRTFQLTVFRGSFFLTILLQIQQENFFYGAVNSDKPIFVSFLVFCGVAASVTAKISSFFFQYNFIEHTHVLLTFTKDNLQQNENYNLKLTKKKPNTIKTLVVTKIKWERNQLSKQNFIPYLKEMKKQTILFWNHFRDQSYKKYIFLD